MKKMLIAVAIVLAAGIMTSCNKGEGCYRLDAKVTLSGVTVDADPIYVYGEGEDIDKQKQDFKKMLEAAGGEAKVTQIKVLKNEEDCKAANDK